MSGSGKLQIKPSIFKEECLCSEYTPAVIHELDCGKVHIDQQTQRINMVCPRFWLRLEQ